MSDQGTPRTTKRAERSQKRASEEAKRLATRLDPVTHQRAEEATRRRSPKSQARHEKRMRRRAPVDPYTQWELEQDLKDPTKRLPHLDKLARRSLIKSGAYSGCAGLFASYSALVFISPDPGLSASTNHVFAAASLLVGIGAAHRGWQTRRDSVAAANAARSDRGTSARI